MKRQPELRSRLPIRPAKELDALARVAEARCQGRGRLRPPCRAKVEFGQVRTLVLTGHEGGAKVQLFGDLEEPVALLLG